MHKCVDILKRGTKKQPVVKRIVMCVCVCVCARKYSEKGQKETASSGKDTHAHFAVIDEHRIACFQSIDDFWVGQ